MFNKSKKPEKKDMVVVPVPIPPKDNDTDVTQKGSASTSSEEKVFTKVAPSVQSAVQILRKQHKIRAL